MKKVFKLGVLLISALSIIACSSAESSSRDEEFNNRPEMNQQQGGHGNGQMGAKGGMKPPMNQEIEEISEDEFYSKLSLDEETETKVKVILSEFKTEMESMMQSSSKPDMESMRKLEQSRDEEVKVLLTDEQYKQYEKTVRGLFVPPKPKNF